MPLIQNKAIIYSDIFCPCEPSTQRMQGPSYLISYCYANKIMFNTFLSSPEILHFY